MSSLAARARRRLGTMSGTGWLPYVPIPKALGSLLPNTAKALDDATAGARDGDPVSSISLAGTSTVAANLLVSASQDASMLIHTSIKRITGSCRQLLLSVLDVSEVTDEHVSLLYTAVVKEFFHTLDVLEANQIDVADLRTFPDDLRGSIEDLVSRSNPANSPALTASIASSGDVSPELAAARASIIVEAESSAANEQINVLVHHLIRSLQDKHRQYLQAAEKPPGGAGGVAATKPKSTVAPNQTVDIIEPIRKLFLQYEDQVKRVKVDDAASLTLAGLQALFVHRFQLVPSTPFPKIYVQDRDSRQFFELEDLTHDLHDGCILKLLPPPPGSIPVSPLVLPGPAAHPSTAPQSHATGIRFKLGAVYTLRRELDDFRADILDQQASFADLVATVTQQVTRAALAASEDGAGALHRGVVTHAKPAIERAAAELRARTADLADTVEQVRLDMVQRSAVPSRATLDYAQTEGAAVAQLVTETVTRIDAVTPAWKRIWESELQRVVAEQHALNDAEVAVDDAADRLDAINALIGQLRRVADLADERGVENVVPRQPAFVPRIDEDEAAENQWDDAVTGILDEIAATPVDHDRRVRALARTEKLREWAKANRPESEFSAELRQFTATPRALRAVHGEDGGGIEALERMREERNRAVIKALSEIQDAVASAAEGEEVPAAV
ncbi:Bud site selection protein 6 [Blastocladiella emersonii ATCC 22665]|nr:Bud site selection protein 6 [Blastocladiella emersonii ATCC 22665]